MRAILVSLHGLHQGVGCRAGQPLLQHPHHAHPGQTPTSIPTGSVLPSSSALRAPACTQVSSARPAQRPMLRHPGSRSWVCVTTLPHPAGARLSGSTARSASQGWGRGAGLLAAPLQQQQAPAPWPCPLLQPQRLSSRQFLSSCRPQSLIHTRHHPCLLPATAIHRPAVSHPSQGHSKLCSLAGQISSSPPSLILSATEVRSRTATPTAAPAAPSRVPQTASIPSPTPRSG